MSEPSPDQVFEIHTSGLPEWKLETLEFSSVLKYGENSDSSLSEGCTDIITLLERYAILATVHSLDIGSPLAVKGGNCGGLAYLLRRRR